MISKWLIALNVLSLFASYLSCEKLIHIKYIQQVNIQPE